MRKLITFYDTETTGLPAYNDPSDAPHQPHIVQLAAVLVDADTREIVNELDVLVRPDGWEIPAETIAIHGITNERAAAEGIAEADALAQFLALTGTATRVAYNESFDARILRIAIKRYRSSEEADEFKAGPADCAMKLAQTVMGGKRRKLVEVYEILFGEKLDGAHNAMADTKAAMRVYFALQDRLATINDITAQIDQGYAAVAESTSPVLTEF